MRKVLSAVAVVLFASVSVLAVPLPLLQHEQHGGGSGGSGGGGGTTTPSTSASTEAARIATREKVRALLDRMGPRINISFKQNDQQPFNFGGVMRGLTNSDMLEVVVRVNNNDTIQILTYPHYKGGYINLDKAPSGSALMRKLLSLNDGFFYWGSDSTNDVYAGFTVTLESGFPDAALEIVLRSIQNLDKVVGNIQPLLG